MTTEEYKAVKIPLSKIKRMIKNGTWEGSLEQEEVVYNLKYHLYSGRYTNKVCALLLRR